MSTLHRLPEVPDATRCSHGSAFEILTTCHEHIQERLLVLENAGIELLDGGDLGDPIMARFGAVLAFLDVAIPIHSADEEESLFPRLRTRQPFADHPGGTPMDQMEHEHREHGDAKQELKVALVKRDAAVAGRCALAMVKDYRDHIAKEEECLYPMAREIITDEAALSEMADEMRARRRDAGLIDC